MSGVSHDSETPAHGQQVFSVCAFIHHDFNGVKKLFVPRRAATKKFYPDVYELPGGHVDFGETFEAAVTREVKEEFDMNIRLGDPFYVFTYDNEVKGSHSVEIIYFATFVDPIENIKIHLDDHSQFKWLSEDELPQIYGIGGKNEKTRKSWP
jgi:8-oxo-dGTP diphosphatase